MLLTNQKSRTIICSFQKNFLPLQRKTESNPFSCKNNSLVP
jgi:hypothetical protein